MTLVEEIRALLRLGGPMVATQFFIMGMGFVDTAMAGRYASLDLAAVALGGNVLWPLFMLGLGCTMALTPIVAQQRGAGRSNAIGETVRQGLWLALGAALVVIAGTFLADTIFALAGIDPAAAELAGRYLAAACWGIPAAMVYVALRHTAEGLGKVLPPMLIAGVALALNALLNWVLIYGKFGLPELGGEGCGWATALVMWFELALMVLVLRLPWFRATGVLARFSAPRWAEIRHLLVIGAPIGITVFLEMAVFSIIGFLIGRLGVDALAGHSIAGNVNWATYVLPMSLGSAASIRVGFFVGARQFEEARHVVRTAVTLSLAYALLVSVLLVALRHGVASIYTQDPAVLTLAANLMLFIAVYQLFDDTQATMAGALRGYKDTRLPMVFSLIGYWLLALPLGAVLGFGWPAAGLDGLGVYGFWAGMTAGLGVVALCMAVRLRQITGDTGKILALAA